MKLLVVTQKVDPTDPILGFFIRWIKALAKHCDEVLVIGQFMGVHSLPENVRVVSLGKEKGIARWRQILRFWVLQWKLRKQYDRVFVHMTPIWIVLGSPLWFLMRKPMYLWYEVRRGGVILTLALRCVRRVFSATSHGLPLASKKQLVVGHGIDVDFFVPAPEEREEGLVVVVGRITKVKHLDVIVRAFAQLSDSCNLVIAGATITSEDQEEEQRLKNSIEELGIRDRVRINPMSNDHVRSLLQRASLVLHAGSGGLDKIILEAMACGCPVVTTSKAAKDVLSSQYLCDDEQDMSDCAERILELPAQERSQLSEDLRRRVLKEHSLTNLVEKLVQEMQ